MGPRSDVSTVRLSSRAPPVLLSGLMALGWAAGPSPREARASEPPALPPPPPPRVRVRAAERIDAHAARSSGNLVVSGTVTDDAGSPGARRPRVLRLVPPPPAPPEACGDGHEPPAVEATGRFVLRADDAGRFCVR